MAVPRPAPYKGIRRGSEGGASPGSSLPFVPPPRRRSANQSGALGPRRAPAFVCGGRRGQWARGRGKGGPMGARGGEAGRARVARPGHVRAEAPPPCPGTRSSPGDTKHPTELSREDRGPAHREPLPAGGSVAAVVPPPAPLGCSTLPGGDPKARCLGAPGTRLCPQGVCHVLSGLPCPQGGVGFPGNPEEPCPAVLYSHQATWPVC